MRKTLLYRNISFGILSWIIPFSISFFCYTPDGQLIPEYNTFKSIMVVSGTISGSYLLYHYFKAVSSKFVLHGLVVGLSWLILNILFDSIVLIPMMKVTFIAYLQAIGLSYISIPAISISMGYLLKSKLKVL